MIASTIGVSTMNDAAHEITFSGDIKNLEESFNFSFQQLAPQPIGLNATEQLQWKEKNWANHSDINIESISDHVVMLTSDKGYSVDLFKKWAMSNNFSGEYAAISADTLKWVRAYFKDGHITGIYENIKEMKNAIAYELRGFHIFETLENTDSEYVSALTDAINYYADFIATTENGNIYINGNDLDFIIKYEPSTDEMSVYGSESKTLLFKNQLTNDPNILQSIINQIKELDTIEE